MFNDISQGLDPKDLPQSLQLGETGVVTTDLGQVMPHLRGEYDPNTTYDYLDVVLYRGCSYITRKKGLKGVTPEEGENWMCLVDQNSAVVYAQSSADSANAAAAVADGKAVAAQTTANNATSRTWTCALSTNWGGSAATGYTQTVSSVSGMTASVRLAGYLIPVIGGSEALSTKKAIQTAVGAISEVVSGASSVTFICYDEKPTTAVSVIVTEVR